MGSVELKTMSKAPDGSGTYLVRFPSKFVLNPSELVTQVVILKGWLANEHHRLQELHYLRIPRGIAASEWSAAPDTTAIVFIDDFGKIDDVANVVAVDVDAIDWRGEIDEHFAPGAARKSIWTEKDSGEELFMLGTLPLRWNTRAQVHPVVEEVFVLSGELIGQNGVMSPGAYFWRPADIWHGPFGQRAGALLLIRSPGGPLEKKYRDYEEPSPRSPDFGPVAEKEWLSVASASARYAIPSPFFGLES